MSEHRFIINHAFGAEETRNLEFKEVKGPNSVRSIKDVCDEYVVAFLNAKGGRIVFGVRDSDGCVVGVPLTYRQRDEIRRVVNSKLTQIRPAISPGAYQINLYDLYEDASFTKTVADRFVIEIIVPRVFSDHLYSTASEEVFIKTDAGKQKLSQEQKDDELRRRKSFQSASDVFEAAIRRNFLFEFEGDNSEYLKLLSDDLRRVFFRLVNESLRMGKINHIVISGREGSGKTFNTLLISRQLRKEGYSVFYCPDIRDSNLTTDVIRSFVSRNDQSTFLIIDNTHLDVEKAASLIDAISQAGSYSEGPKFIFLMRPLERDTFLDTFGELTPTLAMVDKFINFEHLVKLFFQKAKKPESAMPFLVGESRSRLPSFAFGYRNMAFWNEVLRSIPEDGPMTLSEEDILMRAHSFFRRKEPNLVRSHSGLDKLLPLFSQGLGIHLDHAYELLGADAAEILSKLEDDRVLRLVEQDWEWDRYGRTSALIVVPALHVTKVKLLMEILRKYRHYTASPMQAVADYADCFIDNLHYFLAPYSSPEALRALFTTTRMPLITRRYLLTRHLGKKLNRVLERLGTLDLATRDSLIDPNVLDRLAEKVNAKEAYLASKVLMLRALYRADPYKALKLFERLDSDAIAGTFLRAPDQKAMRYSVQYLAKSIEIFKNVYYLALSEEDKLAVQSFVKQIIDRCRAEFLRRLVLHDPFITQLHWMLKRLNGMELASYFLEGVPTDMILQLLRTKNTNIVEFSRIIFSAKYTLTLANDQSPERYSDVLIRNLTSDDLRRIFDNKRSDLYDLATNATYDKFVAKAIVGYCDDPMFAQKVGRETPYLRQRSIALFRSNRHLEESEKEKLTSAIEQC